MDVEAQIHAGLPKSINYSHIKPVGTPTLRKVWKVQSQTPPNQSTTQPDIDVLLNTGLSGFINPYQTFLNIEVDVTNMDSVGCLIIDHNANSFINLYWSFCSTNSEITRIEEYDQLAAMLQDLNHPSTSSYSNIYGGFYHQNKKYHKFTELKGTQSINSNAYPAGGANPGIPPGQLTGGTSIVFQMGPFYWYIPQVSYLSTTAGTPYTDYSKGDTLNYMNIPNPNGTYAAQTVTIGANNYTLNCGANGIARYDDAQAINNFDYSYEKFNDFHYIGDIANGLPNYPIINGTVVKSAYQTNVSNQATNRHWGLSGNYNDCFSLVNEVWMSANQSQNIIWKGRSGIRKRAERIKFQVPLLCPLFGHLMPKESFRLIPLEAFLNLHFKFQMNQYAMYTSGYTDTIFNNSALATQIRRQWKIISFEVQYETLEFMDTVGKLLTQDLRNENGIVIHTEGWLQPYQSTIVANTSGTQSFQLNVAIESLRKIIFFFIPLDYQQYSFCRKHYRISQNLINLQCKIGTNNYPYNPILGHAGIPLSYQITTDNNTNGTNIEFIRELYRSFGKNLKYQDELLINPFNFAINERAYDVTNVLKMQSDTVNNYDTAWGSPMFHEQRVVGKALYCIGLDNLSKDGYVSGVNTTGSNSTITVTMTMDGDSNYSFPRTSSIYFFCQYDMFIVLKANSITTFGAGGF